MSPSSSSPPAPLRARLAVNLRSATAAATGGDAATAPAMQRTAIQPEMRDATLFSSVPNALPAFGHVPARSSPSSMSLLSASRPALPAAVSRSAPTASPYLATSMDATFPTTPSRPRSRSPVSSPHGVRVTDPIDPV